MSRDPSSSEISLQALLDDAKELPRQPDTVRARVLARARLTVAAPPVVAAPVVRPPWATHWILPAAAAVAVGGLVGTLVAIRGSSSPPESARTASASAVGAPPPASVAARSSSGTPPAPPAGATVSSPPVQLELEPASPVVRAAPGKPRREEAQAAYAAELELMRNAHTAYAAHDFTSALVLVGEHARRFPRGLLSEEREALRVRCLLGAGRRNQARVAAEAFGARFPRSVLLHRLQAEVGSTSE